VGPSFIVYSFYKRNPDSQKFKEAIVELRHGFQELGAMFIKLGQLLSARPDIAGPELANEMRNLLDNQVPLSYKTIKKEIETELGKKISDVFKAFDKKALSTASIGQVHRARLKNGKLVAVKVQRENLAYVIEKDLKLFKSVALVLDWISPGKTISFTYIWTEFSDWLQGELDFVVDGKKAEKLAKNLESIKGVRIPKVYWQYSTAKVLVMEFMKGITMNRILDLMKEQQVDTVYELKLEKRIDFDLVIKRTIDALVKQIFVDKFFHGDLHPANIIVLDKDDVALIDFGIMGILNNREHTQFLVVLIALIENDPESLIKLILSFSSNPISEKQKGLLYQEFSRELHKIHGGEVAKVSISHFVTTLLTIGRKYNVVWTSGLVLGAKTIAQIDSIAKQFRLNQSAVALLKPSIDNYITDSFSVRFSKESLYKGVLRLLEAGNKFPESLVDLEKMIQEGIPIKIDTNQGRKTSWLQIAVAASVSIVVSWFLINSDLVLYSPYKTILILIIPILVFIMLMKMSD
jgi:ubiquinone biosynthesis protein